VTDALATTRRTIVVHTKLAGHNARVEAARTNANGIQIRTMRRDNIAACSRLGWLERKSDVIGGLRHAPSIGDQAPAHCYQLLPMLALDHASKKAARTGADGGSVKAARLKLYSKIVRLQSRPARRIPAGAAADPRRPSSRPRRLSYAVAVANSPIDKSAAPVRPPLPPIAPRCGCQYRIRAQSSARRTAPVSSIPRGASSRGRRLG
jgi:hypothetical protein